MSEEEYLKQFALNLAGDYSKLPMRMSSKMRLAMEAALDVDARVRQIDRGRYVLAKNLGLETE